MIQIIILMKIVRAITRIIVEDVKECMKETGPHETDWMAGGGR